MGLPHVYRFQYRKTMTLKGALSFIGCLGICRIKKTLNYGSWKRIQACVSSLYAILLENIKTYFSDNSIFTINCSSCTITNYITSTNDERTFHKINQPSYSLLPINLSQPWFDDPRFYALNIITNTLTRLYIGNYCFNWNSRNLCVPLFNTIHLRLHPSS